jgi:hypothetical protein
MEVLTAPAVSSASPSQTPSAPTLTAKSTVPSPPAQLAHAVQAAPLVSTASPPTHAGQTVPAAHSAPTAAPLVKMAVPVPSATPVTPPIAIDLADPESNEAILAKEVEDLWRNHKQAKSSARKTSKELELIRVDLARALHSLKSVLAHPGCKGEWSSFLDSHSIARTTANRLVDAHQKLITPVASNCTTGATEEPMEDVVRRCLDRYWKKLNPVLTTPEAVEVFVTVLRETAEKSFAANGELSNSPATEILSADPAS